MTQTTEDQFNRFLDGLKADSRLGRYIPQGHGATTSETLVLTLALQLADATEGKTVHPAYRLLEEIDAAEWKR